MWVWIWSMCIIQSLITLEVVFCGIFWIKKLCLSVMERYLNVTFDEWVIYIVVYPIHILNEQKVSTDNIADLAADQFHKKHCCKKTIFKADISVSVFPKGHLKNVCCICSENLSLKELLLTKCLFYWHNTIKRPSTILRKPIKIKIMCQKNFDF